MDKNQILQSEWLDILFDGKNKSYGAYELRKTYNGRLKKAMIISFSIAALFVTVILMANVHTTVANTLSVIDISLEKFKEEIKKVEIVEPIKKEPIKVETVSVTPPKIVKDNEVKPEEEVKTIDQMENVQINNFNQEGEKNIDDNYDIIVKVDADLIFPKNYFETIIKHFESDDRIGMAGGFCYIEKNENWVLENLTDKDHIRGALKAYRKETFKQIGGLKPQMGWDTVDELLCKFYN